MYEYLIEYFLLLISSMCKSNWERVPTNDFFQVVGDDRLSLDEDLLIGLSWSINDHECLVIAGLSSGVVMFFTLLCTVILFTMTILPFFRPSLVYTSRSSSTSSNDSSPDPSHNPPPPTAAILVENHFHFIFNYILYLICTTVIVFTCNFYSNILFTKIIIPTTTTLSTFVVPILSLFFPLNLVTFFFYF